MYFLIMMLTFILFLSASVVAALYDSAREGVVEKFTGIRAITLISSASGYAILILICGFLGAVWPVSLPALGFSLLLWFLGWALERFFE